MLVGLELASNCLQHDCVFDFFPIRSQWDFPCHTKRFCVLRLSATSNTFAVFIIMELHRLKVVLYGTPPSVIE